MIEKETLDSVQRLRAQVLEDTKSETLGNRRVGTIKHRVCPCMLNPFGTTAGE
jgi:hypothetical protein